MTDILAVTLQKLGVIPKRKECFPNMTSAQAKEDAASLEGVVKKEEGSNEKDTIAALRVR